MCVNKDPCSDDTGTIDDIVLYHLCWHPIYLVMAKKTNEFKYGGYNYEFIDGVSDRYLCRICSKIFREPHLAVCCGQHFCESCLLKVNTKSSKGQRGVKERCPHGCAAEGESFQHVINKGLRSEINQLKIKCSNHEKGCEWTGELVALKSHLESEKGCGFVMVPCPNKCQQRWTGLRMLRKDLEKHLESDCVRRPYKCKHCGLKGTYESITDKILGHYDECPAYPSICPNECGVDNIKRRDMKSHRSECPREPVGCPFAEAGCKDAVQRQELDSHVSSNVQQHLLLVMGAYKQMKDKLQETEAKLTTAVQLLNRGSKEDKEIIYSIISCSPCLTNYGDTVTVTMPQVSKYYHSGKVWHSPSFYYSDGYKMCLEVNIKEMEPGVCKRILVKIYQQQSEHDNQLTWPVGHKGRCVSPPPLPQGSTVDYTDFQVCSMEQYEEKSERQLYCAKEASFHLANDCLALTIRYNGCYLRVKVTVDS